MASLSESSVVIALRDWQWRNALRAREYPKPCVGLSGNAEYKLGDTMIQVGERLFLFEIKSKHTNIRDEWCKEKTKLAYQKITELAGDFVARSTSPLSNADYLQLHQSLQCHHFVYWSPTARRNRKVVCASGDLYFTPYFLGIKDRCKKAIWRLIRQCWNEEFKLVLSHGRAPGDVANSIRYEAFAALPMDTIESHEACLVYTTEAGDTHWDRLGLPLPQFQSYVNQLCGGLDEDEDIEVVVMSSTGSYFAYLTKTSDLVAIFGLPSPSNTDDDEQDFGQTNTDSRRTSPTPALTSFLIATAKTQSLSFLPPGYKRK